MQRGESLIGRNDLHKNMIFYDDDGDNDGDDDDDDDNDDIDDRI